MGVACWGPWEPRRGHSQRGGRCLTLVLQGSAEGTFTLSPGSSRAPRPTLTCIFSIISNRSVFCNRDERVGSDPREVRLILSSLGQVLTTPACLVLSGGTKRVQETLWEELCTTDPPEFGQLPSDVSPEPSSWISGRCPNSVCFLQGGGCFVVSGKRYLPLWGCNNISSGVGI